MMRRAIRWLLVALVLLGPATVRASSCAVMRHMLLLEVPMSLPQYVVLFRVRIYQEEIMPAVDACRVRRDCAAFVRLLRRARTHAPRERPGLLGEELHRATSELRRSAEEARSHGNRLPSAELPYQVQRLVSPLAPSRLLQRELDDAIARLEREQAGDPNIDELIPGLVELLCVPWSEGLVPVEDVTGMLGEYLESRSAWIRDTVLMGFPTGPVIVVPGGGAMSVFSEAELARFGVEVSAAGPPTQGGLVRGEYDHLQALIASAMRDKELTLVVWGL